MQALRALSCLLLCASVTVAGGTAAETADPLAAMRAAAEQGVEPFAEAARARAWRTPVIPSRWHTEQVAAPAVRATQRAARGLGAALTRELAVTAPKTRALPAGDALLRQTGALCDVAEWCAKAEGYGNALLAQRALDLAAVGVARLAADEAFPLERVLPVAARLRMPLASAAARQRILNAEAGAELFARAEQADIERVWRAGARGGAAAARADFFRDERPGAGEPVVLAATWERKWHERLVDGLELRSVTLALALVEFRRATGGFPPETANRAANADNPDARSEPAAIPAGQRAFQTAWAKAVGRIQGDANNSNSITNDPRTANLAWVAFNAVQQGDFPDQEASRP
jgi:hypothetical protein